MFAQVGTCLSSSSQAPRAAFRLCTPFVQLLATCATACLGIDGGAGGYILGLQQLRGSTSVVEINIPVPHSSTTCRVLITGGEWEWGNPREWDPRLGRILGNELTFH